jgi:hypothetical protein
MKTFIKTAFSFLFAFASFLICAPAFGTETAAVIGGASLLASYTPMPTGILGMNTQAARMVYENARVALAKAFPNQNVNQFKCTQSFLRLELALSTAQTRYQFQILNQTTGTPFNTEQRLNLQDSFVTSSLGIFIGKPSSDTDTTFELDTYCDTVKYTNAAAMNAIYNGVLQVAVNNDVILPAWDLTRHFYRPQTQTTAAANTPLNQKRLAEDAFYAVEPNITAIGSKNTVLTVNLGAALSAVDANSRIIIVMRGVLAQNSTVIS